MKHVETVNGWDIARSDNGCVAEMAESNGTYVAFQVNVDGTNSITLSNPAWRSLKSEPLTISMRFQRLLYKGPIIADSEEDAVGTQATSSRGVLRLIGIPVEKEDLDFLMKNTSSRRNVYSFTKLY
ncbi:hypothetical protein RirG_004590 [Rhizophagus irregularis DAOM 197198w]|uniref:Uncharacterized protein n=1 Tax=Rhizophagus irregularis (strain DAOM 197198w) TaxID=1432141 RepID=A0A015M3G1_RHIIW|nr:hypothetical protein RirG_004590 [Rhizophagus irregularis DAOM 197198w]